MKLCQKPDFVQLALSVAVMGAGLAFPATVWAAAETRERSPIVSNPQAEDLLQRVLTEPCHNCRRGAPIRRVGGGSRYGEPSLEEWNVF